MKKTLIIILKLLIAVSIVAWLLQNDKLDLKSIPQLFSNPLVLLLSFLLLALQIYIGSIRWKTFLQIRSDKITNAKHIFAIQWIGQLFSSVLPGAVTGDFIKLTYIKKIDEKITTKFLLLSIIADRIIGLISLLFISGVTSIVFYKNIVGLSPEMPKIILINLALLVCGFIGVGFFFLPPAIIDKIKKMIPIKKLADLTESLKTIRIRKKTFAQLIILSALSHLCGIMVFHLVNQSFYQSNIRFQDLMTIIPIGQITVAIPISPSGLGVGHLAYQKLFSFINQTNGAILFNNYWIVALLANLLGLIPYISHRSSKQRDS